MGKPKFYYYLKLKGQPTGYYSAKGNVVMDIEKALRFVSVEDAEKFKANFKLYNFVVEPSGLH